MHRALASRWLNNALNIAERPRQLELPLFLCPSASSTRRMSAQCAVAYSSRVRALPWRTPRRCLHSHTADPTTTTTASPVPSSNILETPIQRRRLPKQCSGCGTLSQTSQPDQPGYFDLGRKAVRSYIGADQTTDRSRAEDKIYEDALKHFDHKELEHKGVDVEALAMSVVPSETRPQQTPKKPLCDRCHFLLHNHTGQSIYHPSMDSIRDTLMESPYKYNHVYHVLDAADFPMSILPQISQLLDTMPLRTKNRRSRAGKFYHGQQTEVSFIITRSDLLAPTKPQVDTLFPYLQDVLRDVLGRSGRNVRLGNVRAVSAKRSWWTKELKEDIWKRGGAGWMVGKANVGKSQLFEAVFPKGRMDWEPSKHQITVDMQARTARENALSPPETESETTPEPEEDAEAEEMDPNDNTAMDEFSLLPPAPKETQYPEMPLVSDLPGTTASPIRVPFGNGRGELIDLPGLERTGLEQHVKEEHRLSLVMQSRIVPEQLTLRPSQSLLLGGFIRITPRDPAPIMLTYSFTPIQPHISRTDKAIGIQEQTGEVNIDNIAVPGTGEKTKLAGSFELKWDVTKQRTGPLTRKDAVGLKVERLPYRVLSTDILIEGVGWVEIVAQMRTKDFFAPKPDAEAVHRAKPEPERKLSSLERLEALAEVPQRHKAPPVEEKAQGEPNWPIVDVYSPEGKFISCRRPMNGWMLNKPRVSAASQRQRPRKSMKGMKKLEKQRRREREAVSASTV
ncbi:Uu.00g066470.m01.CDS01 [Anthostomella pinea]|uniref:Uu.00g066470.m01.CDS01 n=1 Tax=Anthostomella pinea TaxID=933095 RepID=A0AAI8VTY4_9PEZI|nr:Uu.00g066470.m01.CDS01 [Anthostomella pinea]